MPEGDSVHRAARRMAAGLVGRTITRLPGTFDDEIRLVPAPSGRPGLARG